METKEYVWRHLPNTFPWRAQQPKPPITEKLPMSVKDNYVNVVTGKKPMWMPVYGYESNTCFPDVIEEHPVPEVDGFDYWGVDWQMVDLAGGMITRPGTRVIREFSTWKEDVKWPNLLELDWIHDGEKISSNFDPERAHIYQCTEGVFERLHEMMPFDETLTAMFVEPEGVLEFFHRMADYKIDTCRRVFDYYGRIDGVVYHDDWGHQRSGFFSNEMFRELILPPTKRIFDFIKSRDKFIELHSCGRNMQYMDMFIEMGIDMWTPQSTVNDTVWLKEEYGDRMTFAFPIPGLNTPNETEADIRRHVREFVDFYGKGGRMLASMMLPPAMADRAAIARDELYNYSIEFYKD